MGRYDQQLDEDARVLHAGAVVARAAHRRERLLAVVIGVGVLLGVVALAAQSARSTPSGSSAPSVAVASEATGVLVASGSGAPERVAHARPVAGSTIREAGRAGRWLVPSGSGLVTMARDIETEASLRVSTRTSAATASVGRIELLGGRVVLENVKIDAGARVKDGRASGEVRIASGTATVDGRAVKLTPNRQVAVDGVGTVLLNEQAQLAAAPTGDAQTGPRWRVVGAIAHVRLTSEYEGMPAGTEVTVGRVDAAVRIGKVETAPRPDDEGQPDTAPPGTTVPTTSTGSSGPIRLQPGSPRPGTDGLPRRTSDTRAAGGGATASLQGYTFPVLGRFNYVDTWGAPRASTGIPHQGTDIFADEGTPLVAVADGVLDRVGWNSIGGYRLWLFDSYGNSFYYAHLSAFSTTAFTGGRVRAGDVIGFVGHTGDAQYTPPHLHFEVHPGNGAAINPFSFLNAWERGVAVPAGMAGGAQERIAPLALDELADVSANSGLQDGVVDRIRSDALRPIEEERVPQPTDETLQGAIEGPGTSAAS